MNKQELKQRFGNIWIGDGWVGIVTELVNKLDANNITYSVAQIKEKFGTLRVYLTYKNSDRQLVEKLIAEAETKSATTCEVCGDYGQLRTGPWVKTLCDAHSNGKAPLIKNI